MATYDYICCNTCKRRSYSDEDIRRRFCGACHKFHDGPDDYTLGSKETHERVDNMMGMDATSLRSFEHYKGGTYTLLYVARNSELRHELLAVYVSHQTQVIWVRPFDMFCELVTWPDGSRHPRFREITRRVTDVLSEVPT